MWNARSNHHICVPSIPLLILEGHIIILLLSLPWTWLCYSSQLLIRVNRPPSKGNALRLRTSHPDHHVYSSIRLPVRIPCYFDGRRVNLFSCPPSSSAPSSQVPLLEYLVARWTRWREWWLLGRRMANVLGVSDLEMKQHKGEAENVLSIEARSLVGLV